MLEPGAFFQVTDREFDDRVVPMERIGGDGIVCGVGDERVVAPVGEQLGLAASESCATHDKAGGAFTAPGPGGVVGVGDLGFAAECVVDVDPGALGDRRDRCPESLMGGAARGSRRGQAVVSSCRPVSTFGA